MINKTSVNNNKNIFVKVENIWALTWVTCLLTGDFMVVSYRLKVTHYYVGTSPGLFSPPFPLNNYDTVPSTEQPLQTQWMEQSTYFSYFIYTQYSSYHNKQRNKKNQVNKSRGQWRETRTNIPVALTVACSGAVPWLAWLTCDYLCQWVQRLIFQFSMWDM